MLARHFTEAGLIEKAAYLWGKAGKRSVDRSALVEAVEQITRALDQIAALPSTRALRREEIELQAAVITPLIHVKGYAAPETKAAEERARFLIEQAEALGEHTEDPLLLFSVLYGYWGANYVAFNGDALRELAAEFLALAEKKRNWAAHMMGHRLMAVSLTATGRIAEGRTHFDRAIGLYRADEHRALATRFGQDVRTAILSYRPLALWALGFPVAALADTRQAVEEALKMGQGGTLMFALSWTSFTEMLCGNYALAKTQLDEVLAQAEEKGFFFWKGQGTWEQGWLLVLTDKPSDAVQMMTAGTIALRSTGSTFCGPCNASYLAMAYAKLGQLDNAWRCVGEALTTVEKTNERFWEAEAHRIGGEIALMSPEPDADKAKAYFERALAIARQQQAKSWELRAAMSLARLWRDQGKAQEARELIAPVYGWFTEGFDTRDLKDAKALLDELAA